MQLETQSSPSPVKKTKLTPLMEQYWAIKNQHPDKVLFFRMGDFFEMFHQDAEIAAPILNIALTQRNKKAQDETKMCGVPHHSIATPIAKLLAAGHKVALCDQIEDPKQAKGIVKRAVTRILSPGMVYDPETLDALSANYMASFDGQTVAFLDPSTAEAFYYNYTSQEELGQILQILSPKELVLSSKERQGPFSKMESALGSHALVSVWDDGSVRGVAQKEGVELPLSARRLLSYSQSLQGDSPSGLASSFERRRLKGCLELSPTVLRHLEVFSSYRGEAKGSLFHSINRTKTAAGARRLRSWLSFPLREPGEIEARLDQVDYWHQHPQDLREVRQLLASQGDIERRLGKLSLPNANARDLLALADSLRVGLEVSSRLPRAGQWESSLLESQRLVGQIDATIEDEPPLSTKEGAMIRLGFRADLDQLISLSKDSQSLVLELEGREREKTGIPSLKVRYNSVFGYYIEVTHTHASKVPAHYLRKQTLTNAERYTTEELQDLERKVLSSRSRRAELEFEIFEELKKQVLGSSAELLALARWWSEEDVLTSMAWLALEGKYVRPSFSDSADLCLKSSRHPVVEQEVQMPFVPNSVDLKRSTCLLLTGPNMAGKSTLMRQVAVIAIMAQCGFFVPAAEARLPLFDQIFTRVGASDFLSEGLSTFMVEMKETAQMLKSATSNSLVILDEVGRGTSTYDGMSLAQAILEYLVTEVGAITLFATHYHELTALERKFPQIFNAHMAIHESKGEISFLHSLMPGPAQRSYGIQVAKLAGLPAKITHRAGKLLESLESFGHEGFQQMSLLDAGPAREVADEQVMSPEQPEPSEPSEWEQELVSLSVSELTPLDALNLIAKWQKDLSSNS